MSDNAICYNDIAAGSISIGGFQSIYSMQYPGSGNPTGILGTGVLIIAQQYYNGNTSVLYLSNPINASNNYQSYSGLASVVGGGAGGNAILINNLPINTNIVDSLILNMSNTTDDSLAIYLNGIPIKDDFNGYPSDPIVFDILALASSAGLSINIGDTLSFYGKDNFLSLWSTQTWTGVITFGDGYVNTITGGVFATGVSTGVAPVYRPDGYLIVSK